MDHQYFLLWPKKDFLNAVLGSTVESTASVCPHPRPLRAFAEPSRSSARRGEARLAYVIPCPSSEEYLIRSIFSTMITFLPQPLPQVYILRVRVLVAQNNWNIASATSAKSSKAIYRALLFQCVWAPLEIDHDFCTHAICEPPSTWWRKGEIYFSLEFSLGVKDLSPKYLGKKWRPNISFLFFLSSDIISSTPSVLPESHTREIQIM